MRSPGDVLQMKDDRLPKMVRQPSRAKRKVRSHRLGWEDVISLDLREMGIFWERVKREALNTWGWRRSLCSYVGLIQLGPQRVFAGGSTTSYLKIDAPRTEYLTNSFI